MDDRKYFFDLAADYKAGEEVPMLPWAKALIQQHADRLHKDDPLALCMPPGVPRVSMNENFPGDDG